MNDDPGQKPGQPDQTVEPGQLVFRYSREHRLARASAEVRAFNEEEEHPRKGGFFRLFTANRSVMFLAIAVALLMAVYLVTSLVGHSDASHRSGGDTWTLAAFAFDRTVYATVTRQHSGSGVTATGEPVTLTAVLGGTGDSASRAPAGFSIDGFVSADDHQVFRLALPRPEVTRPGATRSVTARVTVGTVRFTLSAPLAGE